MNGPSLASVGQLTDIHDSALNPLGTKQRIGFDEYIYLKGVASVVAGDAVTYDEVGQTVRLVTGAAPGPVAAALAAVVADKYGWFQCGGSAVMNVATGFADNGRIFSTATAGVVDDAVVADSQVDGAVGRSAIASGQATVQLSNPWFGSDTTA